MMKSESAFNALSVNDMLAFYSAGLAEMVCDLDCYIVENGFIYLERV